MRHTALSLAIAAALVTAACLQKDTTSTIYLRRDGSFDWVILEQNVRSDANIEASQRFEEADYVAAVSRGEQGTANGLLALGGEDVRVRWLRSTRPYAVMANATFASLAGIFDRLLPPCGVPYENAMTELNGITTWTLRVDVGIDGERLEEADSDACGRDLDGLDEAFENLRIIVESGSFTAATGFVLTEADTAAVDDDAIEAIVKTTGVVELSLSWR